MGKIVMARPKSKIVKPKRARGGQPGNTNRRKHGFYARTEIEGRAEARRLFNTGMYLVAALALREADVTTPIDLDSREEREGRGRGFPGSNRR